MATEATYKRGQVEQALWETFTHLRSGPAKPPKIFLIRIKRLLDVDREREGYEGEAPSTRFAFFDESQVGKGADVPYTPFNAFCLAIGLDMLDAGFKQSEIVFLLRHIRGELEDQFKRIMRRPPAIRQRILAKDQPECPTFEEDNIEWADCRVFAVINKVEIKEIFSDPKGKMKRIEPLILEPVFCHGISALYEELQKMNHHYRKALVLEIAYLAKLVTDFLKDAPLVKRGRK
jgi:hypothetical protein